MNSQSEMNPEIDLTKEDEFPAGLTQETHDNLLSYLLYRIDKGNILRPDRLARYAMIDKTVSTWQRLTAADSERKTKQEVTGQSQAINTNLPLLQTHLEDMISFFAAIYSPTTGDFLAIPDPELEEQGKSLIEKLNVDAKAGKYFKNLSAMIRSVLKYNISGFSLEWIMADTNQANSSARNYAEALDMYNFLWDPAITDPSKIAVEAEWAARIKIRNRRYLAERDGDEYIGMSPILDGDTNGNTAKYYRNPPNQAGLTYADQKSSRTSGADWASYGASLGLDSVINVDGYEEIEMYCWLSPGDFGLDKKDANAADYVAGYYLYRFKILDGTRIVAAEAFDTGPVQGKREIPYYIGFLNQDDMGEAQRSQAELLAPFQTYASFLVNADVAAARGSIWGIQGYDPSMFDLGSLPEGATSGRIPSKVPGRDVRSGLQSLNGVYESSKTMEKLAAVMQIVQQLFPSQALPNQVANIDRAVQSQVAAVMQGVSRRLHMLVRVMDDDIMNPFRMACYRNLVENEAINLAGLTDDKARKILGSGLQQLNREAAGQAMQQLLFAVIQNPQTAAEIDVLGLMNFWGGLLNMSIDLSKFAKQAPVAPPGTTPPAAPTAGGPVVPAP